MTRVLRLALLVLHAFVAVTALGGGLALIIGSLVPSLRTVLVPPEQYLEGSPFASYLVPGLTLLVLVCGSQAAAFVAVLRHSRWAATASASAGIVCTGWIFVQMVYIPFSVLQALYFAVGLAQLGLTMLTLGVLPRAAAAPHPQ